MQETKETLVWSLGQEDPPEEGMASYTSILLWKNLMDRGIWQATVHGVQRVGHDWVTDQHHHHNKTNNSILTNIKISTKSDMLLKKNYKTLKISV